jgi:hypothetical protein
MRIIDLVQTVPKTRPTARIGLCSAREQHDPLPWSFPHCQASSPKTYQTATLSA